MRRRTNWTVDDIVNYTDTSHSERSTLQTDWFEAERKRDRKRRLLIVGRVVVGLIAVVIAAAVVTVILNRSGIMSTIVQGIDYVVMAIFSSAFISLIIWSIILSFAGKIISSRFRLLSFGLIFFVVLICQFVPSLGSSLGAFIFMVAGVIYLIHLMLK